MHSSTEMEKSTKIGGREYVECGEWASCVSKCERIGDRGNFVHTINMELYVCLHIGSVPVRCYGITNLLY